MIRTSLETGSYAPILAALVVLTLSGCCAALAVYALGEAVRRVILWDAR